MAVTEGCGLSQSRAVFQTFKNNENWQMAKSSGLSKKVRRMLADFFQPIWTMWRDDCPIDLALQDWGEREGLCRLRKIDSIHSIYYSVRPTQTELIQQRFFFLLPNITDKSIFHNNHSEVPSPSPNLYNRRYDLMSPTRASTKGRKRSVFIRVHFVLRPGTIVHSRNFSVLFRPYSWATKTSTRNFMTVPSISD